MFKQNSNVLSDKVKIPSSQNILMVTKAQTTMSPAFYEHLSKVQKGHTKVMMLNLSEILIWRTPL